jgi:hypothetical protein
VAALVINSLGLGTFVIADCESDGGTCCIASCSGTFFIEAPDRQLDFQLFKIRLLVPPI